MDSLITQIALRYIAAVSFLAFICISPALSQSSGNSQGNRSVPIYSVTIVQRALKAVSYQSGRGPTRIDMKGTVLLPKAEGEAKVEVMNGYTEINATFKNVEAPTRFGAEYLTYVLWAITPDGRSVNLGELILNASDKGKMRVTCPYSTFGLLVTAEPYFSVPYPSDVVVMENVIRPNSGVKVEDIQAKYNLLPRGQYTLNISAQDLPSARMNQEPKVSMPQYEAMLALYQARNAVQIARADGAGDYAADTLNKAQQLLSQAEEQYSKKEFNRVTNLSRQSVQAASDARAIAMNRKPQPQRP
jgi:hypothetical protein